MTELTDEDGMKTWLVRMDGRRMVLP